MAQGRKIILGVCIIAGIAAGTGAVIYKTSQARKLSMVTGAVLTQDSDPNKQRPIGDVTITVTSGYTRAEGTSDNSGLFRLRLQPALERGQTMNITFRHRDHQPHEVTAPAEDALHVVRLRPLPRQSVTTRGAEETAIANIRVRYSTKSTSTVNVGSALRTFQVENEGNVPCRGQRPCSPDGKWKATVGSVSIDTGDDSKQFRNSRLSCIAGPCPFSRVESDGFTRGGKTIEVAVRNWSDSVTYLLEAEVAQTIHSDMVRHSYPVIFGRSMNFTLPAGAQGLTIEADTNGEEIVYPMGPSLQFSWASCQLEVGADKTRLYQCTLKPQYRFK